MAKEELIEFEGKVTEVSRDVFRVQLTNGHIIIAYLGGKMRKNRIVIMVGDTVIVEMTPYDLTKGRIVHRGLRPVYSNPRTKNNNPRAKK